MKPLVIYHADCTDGYGAAFAAWMKLGGGAEYRPTNYNEGWAWAIYNEDGTAFDNRDVYILDFSFSRQGMDYIFANAKRVVWLDHHLSAFQMWEPNSLGCLPLKEGEHYETYGQHKIILHPNKSGALLAWEYFHPNTEVPMLIRHIDDRDRWQFKLEGSRELHAYLGSLKPWSFDGWDAAFKAVQLGGHEEVLAQGAAILRAQDQHVKQMVKQARKCEMRYWGEPVPHPVGLAVNASLHQSEVGHELANQGGTYGLVWYLGSDNKVRCSLRSNGDYDVSAIAKSFGGGGHRNAAGFETDINTLVGWLK